MPEKAFSALEEAIMDELAVYQFLTAKQLLTLGVTRDRKRVYEALRALRSRKPKVVEQIEFGALPKIGTLSALYALTPRGAEILQERYRRSHSVPVHKRVDTFKNQYFHRVATVDFHIATRQWADIHDQQVDFFYTYFDPVPGGGRGVKLTRKTRVTFGNRWFEPDAIFALKDARGTQRIFVYELYLGQRTQRVVEQLETHVDASYEDAVEETYQATGAVRHLVVFDAPANLELAQRRMRVHSHFTEVEEFFFLSTNDATQIDWKGCWQRFDGTPATLF